MQFKVPQNIDLADRVVGPLTLVQFLYLLTGGIVVYILFSVVAPVNIPLFFGLSIPIGVFSFALAFLKIQDQPFGKFVVAFMSYLSRPKIRVWAKEGLDPEVIVADNSPKKSDRVPTKAIKKSELEKLSQALDTGGTIARAGGTPAPTPQPSRPTIDGVRKK